MTTQVWFRKFLALYEKDKEIKRLIRSEKYNNEGLWTPAMMDLLRRMGESFGSEVSREKPVAGGGRSDQRWVKENGSVVYIEHENRCDDKIQGEIQKLCNDVSKLKVLITYVADRNFNENVRQLNEKIEKAIHDCGATFSGEFLLVVCGNEENKWEAHISVLKMETLQIKGGRI